jgi:acyl-homoserine-lactone acylase
VCATVGVLAVFGASLAIPAAGQARSSALKRVVTVTRDRSGIPHIVARNFTALGYGEGYTFAADNLCTFANDIVTLRGQRSQYFGPKALAINYSAGTSATNLQSDLYWHYVQRTTNVKQQLRAKGINGLLPQVREVYTGFVAGYNRYLRSGKLNDPTCKGKPWVKPITLTDMLLRGAQIETEGSAQQFESGIVEAAPPTPAVMTPAARRANAAREANAARDAKTARQAKAASANAREFSALKQQFGDQADRSQGSNGIGLGAQDTRAKHGMVLANPHFPWVGTERFWMAQLDVPGQYDVEGGTLMGFPLIGIGFNRNLAWTHTVSTSRRFVAYQLKLVPGDPTSYYLDGKPTKMGQINVTARYGATTVHHTFYTTHWGVVVNVNSVPDNAYVWNTSTAYALYDATHLIGPRTADQYFRMGQAKTVRGLFNVEAKYLAIPTFNTISADDHGNAYYGDVGATPAVSAAEIKACLPAGFPTLVYQQARVVTLDGSRTSCAPASTKGLPQQGIFPARQEPHTFRRDYVENSNDSYWLANPTHPLTGYSPIIGLTGTVQGLRTRIGNLMIAARVKGTDGLGKPRFTISTLQRMWQRAISEEAALVLSGLTADCQAHPTQVASNGQTVDLTSACAALAAYNGSGRLAGSTGGWLFSVWAHLDTDANLYSTAFNPSQPLTTPSGFNPGTPTAPATPLKWLADAVQNLQAHGIPAGASYGQVQHAPQGRKLFVPGCDTGCFDAIYAQDGTPAVSSAVDAAPYGQVYTGSSLVMTTQLNPSGPVSQGILTYSQATNPRSRWHANLTRIYAKSKWVKLPYTAAALKHSHPLKPQVLRAR